MKQTVIKRLLKQEDSLRALTFFEPFCLTFFLTNTALTQ